MKKYLIIILLIPFVTSCAFTNAIHNSRAQMRSEELIKLESQVEQSYDVHKYEGVGTVLDVLTGIIQVPLCVIAILSGNLALCSEGSHPITGGLIPG